MKTIIKGFVCATLVLLTGCDELSTFRSHVGEYQEESRCEFEKLNVTVNEEAKIAKFSFANREETSRFTVQYGVADLNSSSASCIDRIFGIADCHYREISFQDNTLVDKTRVTVQVRSDNQTVEREILPWTEKMRIRFIDGQVLVSGESVGHCLYKRK